MATHAVVLLFDDEQFASDDHLGRTEMIPKMIAEIGAIINNEVAAGWYGYTSWCALHDLTPEFLKQLNDANLSEPGVEGNDDDRYQEN